MMMKNAQNAIFLSSSSSLSSFFFVFFYSLFFFFFFSKAVAAQQQQQQQQLKSKKPVIKTKNDVDYSPDIGWLTGRGTYFDASHEWKTKYFAHHEFGYL
jgi:hypothetical protein